MELGYKSVSTSPSREGAQIVAFRTMMKPDTPYYVVGRGRFVGRHGSWCVDFILWRSAYVMLSVGTAPTELLGTFLGLL